MFSKNLSTLLLVILLLLQPFKNKAQTIKSGSIESLHTENGFKNIRLGENIFTLEGKLHYLDDDRRLDGDSCISYACNMDDVLKIDSTLTLDLVGIRTYKNKVVNIYLFFDEKDAYKVLFNFLQNYGQYTSKPAEYTDTYKWDTPLISLTLSYRPDLDKGVAIFTCKKVAEDIRVDTQRRQKEIASLQAYNVQ